MTVINTIKFISSDRFGAINKRISPVRLIHCTRIDVDNDSGRGYMISAIASYINGIAAPENKPVNAVDKPIVATVDGRIGLS
jgi:hypothetical protein